MSPCKRDCCWSPFQVCAKKQECSCHRNLDPVHQKLTFEELARAQAIRDQKNERPRQ